MLFQEGVFFKGVVLFQEGSGFFKRVVVFFKKIEVFFKRVVLYQEGSTFFIG